MNMSLLNPVAGSRKGRIAILLSALAFVFAFAVVLAGLARAQDTDCTAYYQPLCADVPVALDHGLTFDGTEGELADGDGQGTGFTMVQPKSNPAGESPYKPANLNVDGGQLKITTTSGIQFRTGTYTTNPNSLDNGLGVGFDAANKPVRIETTIVNPPNGSNKAEQAGLWFGPNEDNYVKLVIGSTGTSNSTYRFQMAKEIGGGLNGDATKGPEEINTGNFALSNKTVKLTLVAEPATGKVTGLQSIDGAPETQVGSVNVPASFFDGTTLSPKPEGANSLAGVFATHRNRATTANPPALVYSFDGFEISETTPPDTTPPAAPADLQATAGDGQVALDWADNAAADGVAGYDVFRSTSANGTFTKVNASALTSSDYTDSAAQNGTIYYYNVKAADGAGNVSAASASASAMPDVAAAPSFTLPVKINFQNEAAPVPTDYVKDSGKNYANTRGFGWVVPGTSDPLNLDLNGRDRNDATVTDQRLDTLMHMQYPPTASKAVGNSAPGAWEIALPDGKYDVEVSVGDASPGNDATSHEINVEGVKAIDDFVTVTVNNGTVDQATGADRFKTGTAKGVAVSDGELTIDAIGGTNTKINYVDIQQAADEPPADTTAPAVPAGLTATPGDGKVDLSWDAVVADDLAGYNVYRDGAADPLNATPQSGTTFTDESAENGTEYSYTVTAVDNAGNESDKSAAATATPVAPPPADAADPDTTLESGPEGLTNNDKPSFSWTGSDDATAAADLQFSYRLNEGATEGQWSAYSADKTVVLGGAEGLADGSYTFQVRAKDAAGKEDASPAARSFTVDTTAPGTKIDGGPTGEINTNSASFTFSADPAEEGVKFECALGDQVDENCTSPKEYQNLNDGPQTFSVAAVDAAGNKDESPAQQSFTVSTAALGAPVISAPLNDSYDNDGDFTVEGTAEAGSTVEVREGTTAVGTPATATAEGNWIVTLEDVVQGKHTYTAVATKDGKTSEASAPVAITVDTTRPGAPGTITATASQAGIKLDWPDSTVSDLAGYNVYRADSADGPFEKLNASALLTDSVYEDATAKPGAVSYYQVKTVDKAGNESLPRTKSATRPAADSAPAAPDGLVLTASGRGISLDWANNTETDLAGYNVYRSPAPGGEAGANFEKLNANLLTASAYNDAQAPADAMSYYRVTAVDGAGNESAPAVDSEMRPAADPPCDPYSQLPCAEVPVGTPYDLDWSADDEGGLLDKSADTNGDGTGFTMVQPSSNGGLYLPENLDVDTGAGTLTVKTTKGIQFKKAADGTNTTSGSKGNGLDNGLGVGFDPAGKTARIETTVVDPPGTGKFEQGGLWFGPSEDNYFKIAVVSQAATTASSSGYKVQMLRELNGVSRGATNDPATNDEYNTATNLPVAGAKVRLILDADPVARTVTGQYSINGGPLVTLGTFNDVPASFFDGSTIAPTGSKSLAGIYATHRNNVATAGLNYVFDGFSVEEAQDTEAPAAPTGLAAVAGDNKVDLTWTASAASDIAGYNVYRSTSDTVDASGTPLNGATLLQDAGYTDATAQNGTTYHYVVEAVDAAGNKSQASARISATPQPATTGPQIDVKVNFQDATGAVPAGYLEDHGQAYGQRTEGDQGSGSQTYGWIDPASATKAPLDLSVGGSSNLGNGRTRNTVQTDQRLESLMHMQADDISGAFNGTAKEGAWELAVPNGTYKVTVAAGDSALNDYANDPEFHTINVEGVKAIDRFAPSGAAGTATHHQTSTVTVTVNDGKLTVDAAGGQNTKINYIDVLSQSTEPDAEAPAAPANVVARAGDGRVTVTWNPNTETDIAGYNVYSGTVAEGTPLNGAELLAENYLIDRPLPNGTERAYVVEAVDLSGNKKAAGVVRATPEAGATADSPSVSGTIPTDGETDVALGTTVAATLNMITDGVDESTFSMQTVKLFEVNADGSNGAQVNASYGTSGGNDVINLIPTEKLKANTKYRYEVTSGVKDLNGIAFRPYTSTFTTGTSDVFNPPGVTTGDVGTAAFDRISQPNVPNKTYTSVTMGPDGKLYAGTTSGEIYRFDVDADGDLANPQIFNTIRNNNNDCNTGTIPKDPSDPNYCTTQRLIIGLTFEPGSTAANPKLWVTHSTAGFRDMKDWGGKLSVLSGSNLGTYRDVLVNLPRSSKDHLTNSVVFKDGKIFIPVGATTAMGAYDSAWKGTERLLSAAVIEVDYQNVQGTLDVKTADGGTYNPYAANAPVKIFATGVRNAVDLVAHSNGHFYAPTNGSAGGSNAPATPSNFADLPQCQNRTDGPYTGPAVPDFDGTANGTGSMKIDKTQDDYLFKVVRGGYYGNPNPSRCEWVLNGGNPTAGTGNDPGENPAYPAGTLPDRNWRGWAYDFKNNKSPNGALEYKSDNFGGKLKGKLIVARYTTDDIVVLEPGANGDIASHNIGVTGFTKVVGSEDPLDIIEDTTNGNLYVTEGVKNPPDGSGKITLLRARDGGIRPANIGADKERLVYNDVQNGTASASQTVTVKNDGGSNLTIDNVALSGTDANQFQITAAPTGSVTLLPGETQQISVAFNPTSVGPKGATLDITSNDPDTAKLSVKLRGLGTLGTGGSNEPSLQWILDTYEIPVNVGDPDKTNNSLPSVSTPIGDEIAGLQKMQAANSDVPVTVEPLAVFGPQHTAGTVTKVGRYMPGSASGAKTELFTVPNASYQSLQPATQGELSFETPDAFGLYSIWPFFNNREVFSEDALNTWETNAQNRHKVRVYPLKNADGSVVSNAYIVATEEHTSGYDYQDVVYILRNVKPAEAPTGNQEIASSAPEMIFSGVKGTQIATKTVEIRNTGGQPLEISGASITGTNAGSFQLVDPPSFPLTVDPGASRALEVRFAPNSTTVGPLEAKLDVASNDADEGTSFAVGLYGLSTNGEQGNNEPTLMDVAKTLGNPIKAHDLSGNPLTFGTDANLKGDEVRAPLFRKAGNGNVTVEPVARYSPDEKLPFGYYKLVDGNPTETVLATIDLDQEQTLLPQTEAGGTTSFDPGADKFGIFVNSLSFGRKSYQQDGLNTGPTAHAVRVYPAKDRAGQPVANTYLVTFEDASNGDYQDYVYRVTNVQPTTAATSGGTTTKINFQPAGTAPTDYTADTGQAFDATRGFGWVVPGTSTPVSKTADTRDRAITHPATATGDRLKDTLVIMAPSAQNTNVTSGAWEHVVPNGTYTVKVSVGDPSFTDSTHRLNVEGVNAIDNFAPTSTTKFAEATVTATVNDGRLTIDQNGGNQTKINYVEITGEGTATEDTTNPTATLTLSGLKDAAGAYKNKATVTIDAEDEAGGSGLKAVTYSINNGAFKAYTAPFDITEAGDYTIRARAEDNAGHITTTQAQPFKVVIPPPSKAEIEVENLDGVPFNDRLAFNRIQNPQDGTKLKKDGTCCIPVNGVHDIVTLRIKNTGVDPLGITGLPLTGPFELVDGPTLPANVPAGGQLDVKVKFNAQEIGTAGGLHNGTLLVQSDDANEAELKVELSGFWQIESEGGKEPDNVEINKVFGYGTQILGPGQQLNNSGRLMAVGDEILSPYWQRADATKPVSVRQLAAFHSQGATASFFWHAKGSNTTSNVVTHNGIDGQSLLPRKAGSTTLPASGAFTPSVATFGFKIDPEWSDWNKNSISADKCSPTSPQGVEEPGCVLGHHFRTWPARDRAGNIIPNTYLMGMDYSGINYDFNDNVYLVSNIKPEDAAINPATPAPAPGAASLALDFDKAYTGTLNDADGQGTGFKETQPNKNDTSPGSNSYDPTKLNLDAADLGLLKVTTSGDTNGGGTNGLVNGLRNGFDATAGTFNASVKLAGPLNALGTGQGGVMWGSDQNNFVKVNAINKNNIPSIEFFVERGGNNSATAGNGTISSAAIPNGGNVQSLELYLIGDPKTGEIRAAYRADSGNLTAMQGKVTLTDAQYGRFFAQQAKAGIIAHHATSTNPAVTVSFDRFAVQAGDPATNPAQRSALYRLDVAGSGDYTDALGNVWTPDTGLFAPSNAPNEGVGTTTDILGTQEDVLYRTYRGNVGNVAQAQRTLSYALPTRGLQQMDVRLHFAERAHSTPDKRIFDIEAEGKLLRDDYDIFFAAGGKDTATTLQLNNVAVTDGTLNLAFKPSVDYAAISAIEVLCDGECPAPDTQAPAAPTGLAATASTSGIALDWANNTEADLAGYNVYRSDSATGTFTKLTAEPVTASQYSDVAAPSGTASYYQVKAVDGSGNESGAATANATRPASTQAAIRINAGGAAQTVNGTTWSACSSLTNCSGRVTGGGPYSEADTNTGIPANMNNAIFQSEWTGGQSGGLQPGQTAFTYNVPVQSGTYNVRLHFSELNKFAAGLRLFDVNVEGGALELNDFDVFAAAGGANKAIVREFPTTVADGNVTIQFITVKENAKVSAIEIIPTAPTDTQAPAAPTGLAATASGEGIALDWANNTETDLAGYNVYRAASATGSYTKLNGALVTASQYNDAAAPGGTSYYQVKAVDNSGNESAASGTANATRPQAGGFTNITWSDAAPNPLKRHEAFGGFASDGKLYLFGGYYGDSQFTPSKRADVYSPASNTWTQIKDLPTGISHAGFAADGKNLYIAGGYPQQADGTGQNFSTTAVWKYNVDTNAYTAMPGLPAARGGGALALEGRTLHFFGGSDGSRADSGGHWTLNLDGGTSWVAKAALPTPRNHLGAAAIGGKVYAVGGQSGQDAAAIYRNNVHAYDPATNAWTAVANLPKARSHNNASTFTMDGRIIVIGGEPNYGSSIADVTAYDPQANAWKELTPLPQARNAGVAGHTGGVLYHATGNSTTVTFKGVPEGVTPPPVDTTAPSITGKAPQANATGIAAGANVTATFSEEMDAATIGAATFTLKEGATTIPAAVSYDAATKTATLDPGADLKAGTQYTATVTTGAKDKAGNALAQAETWTFTTAAATQPGTAIRINAGGPAQSLSGVNWGADQYFSGGKGYTNAQIADIKGTTDDAIYKSERSATQNLGSFSYAIPVSESGTYTVKLHFAEIWFGATGGGAGGAGKRVFDANIEGGAVELDNYDINADVGPMTASVKTYDVAVSDGTLNIAFSASVDQPKVSAIEVVESGGTPPPVDTQAPTVASTVPATGATNVAAGSNVSAVFSEDMKGSTISSTSFTLTAQGATSPVNASVAYAAASKTAALNPAADLAAGTTYTARVTTGVQDAAGNAMASDKVWSFTTAQAADTQAPAAPAITAPANNSFDADGNITVSGTAEANSSVELFEGTTSKGKATASGTGAWSIALTGVADGPHTYTAKATDAANNTSPASGAVTVTVDKAAPAVTGRAPAANATGVAVGTNVTATFNDDMTASTLTGANFKLTEGTSATPIAASVTYSASAKTATLNPSADLKAGTQYTATVTTGAKDKAGNALANADSWSFTTAATQPVQKTALFVVGSTTLNAADSAVQKELVARGYTVTVQTASATSAASANGKSLVLISSTVSSPAVGTKFRNVAVPVIVWEQAQFASANLGMSTGNGWASGQSQVAIVNANHPLAGGLSLGNKPVVNSGTFAMGYGVPNANAAKIATIVGKPNQATVFGYEKGAQMPGLAAPARRVGLFLNDTTATNLNANGLALLRAAIDWAVGGATTPPPTTQSPIRINTGGTAQTVGSTTWSACSSLANCSGWVTGGFAYSEADTNTGIPAGMNNAIFQSEWTGGGAAGTVAFAYNVPVQNGDYTVRLHFSELNKFAPNLRLFDVNVEGGPLELNDFDVYAAAGGANKAIVREFPVSVTDGQANIQFITVKENAKVSAIEILPAP